MKNTVKYSVRGKKQQEITPCRKIKRRVKATKLLPCSVDAE
jgi:hypothetical protein